MGVESIWAAFVALSNYVSLLALLRVGCEWVAGTSSCVKAVIPLARKISTRRKRSLRNSESGADGENDETEKLSHLSPTTKNSTGYRPCPAAAYLTFPSVLVPLCHQPLRNQLLALRPGCRFTRNEGLRGHEHVLQAIPGPDKTHGAEELLAHREGGSPGTGSLSRSERSVATS